MARPRPRLAFCLRREHSYEYSTQPFFHLIANGIADEIGEEDVHAILATTVLAFAFSSILTGQSIVLVMCLVG